MTRRYRIAAALLLAVLWAAGARAGDPLVDAARESGRMVLGEFISQTCPACDELKPVLLRVLKRHPEILHQVHDADREPELAKRYGVKCVPVLVIVDPGGNVRFNQVGFWTEEELEQILREAARPSQ